MNKKINLLPDSKQEQIKTQRVRRITMAIALAIIAAAVAGPLLLLAARQTQVALINNLDRRIAENQAAIEAVEDVDTLLTVQSQLASLAGLYAGSPNTVNIFSALAQTMPSEASLVSLSYDQAGSVTISGSTNSIASVQKFVLSLEAAEFTSDNLELPQNVFDDVELISVSPDTEGVVGFEISFFVNPEVTNNG